MHNNIYANSHIRQVLSFMLIKYAEKHINTGMETDAREEQLKLLADIMDATGWPLARIAKEASIDTSSLYRFVNKDNKNDGLQTISAKNHTKLTALHKRICAPANQINQKIIWEAYNLFQDIIRRRGNLTVNQEAKFLGILQNTIASEFTAYGKITLSLKAAESLLDNAVLQENTSEKADAPQLEKNHP